MNQVVFIEDNADLLEELSFQLQFFGYDVICFESAEYFRKYKFSQQPHLYIIDINLPGESGLSLCNELRKKSLDYCLIVLTANVDEALKINSYVVGVDHFLEKPVKIELLIAILNNYINKLKNFKPVKKSISNAWVLNEKEMIISSPAGSLINLTGMDIKILKVFGKSPEFFADRDVLAIAVGIDPLDYDTPRIETNISRLRHKLSIHANQGNEIIKAVRNKGYRFTADLEILF